MNGVVCVCVCVCIYFREFATLRVAQVIAESMHAMRATNAMSKVAAVVPIYLPGFSAPGDDYFTMVRGRGRRGSVVQCESGHGGERTHSPGVHVQSWVGAEDLRCESGPPR